MIMFADCHSEVVVSSVSYDDFMNEKMSAMASLTRYYV